MLVLRNVTGGYGAAQVLQGVALEVAFGGITAMLGRNGVGKTTTLRAVMGLLSRVGGSITLDGSPLAGQPPHRVARAGLGYVPEGRQIYPDLTVRENLLVGQRRPSRMWTPERLFTLLPNLRDRLQQPGRALSGGEQQMLAIGRALVTDPRVLLLDEPSQGLAPLIVRELAAVLRRLAAEGVAILLVEQNLRLAEAVADQVLVMARGRIVHAAAAAAFAAAPDALRRRLLAM